MSKQLFKGPGLGTSEWREAFTLTDEDGLTPLFSVDLDGTITTTGNQFVPLPNDVTIAGNVDIGGDTDIAGSVTIGVDADIAGDSTVAGTLGVTGDTTLAGDLVLSGSAKKLDLSAISAGNPSMKITATSDTPTVTFDDDGSAGAAPTTAPAGYLEVLVGSDHRYIPFWA